MRFSKNAKNNVSAVELKIEEISLKLVPKDVFAILVQIDVLVREMETKLRFLAKNRKNVKQVCKNDKVDKNDSKKGTNEKKIQKIDSDSGLSQNKGKKAILVVNCKLKRFELFISVLDESNKSVLKVFIFFN